MDNKDFAKIISDEVIFIANKEIGKLRNENTCLKNKINEVLVSLDVAIKLIQDENIKTTLTCIYDNLKKE